MVRHLNNFEKCHDCEKHKTEIREKREKLKTLTEKQSEFKKLQKELNILNDKYRDNC